MRQWKRDFGAALAGVLLLAPAVSAADPTGEPREWSEGRGWLPRTDDAVLVAWHRHRVPARPPSVVLGHRRTSSRYGTRQESYLALKVGGLRVGDDPATEGVFLGFEVGGALENVFEIGFSADYYYRHTEELLVLGESSLADLPLEVISTERTSAHLLPIGVTLRLRLPMGGTVSPFVSTTLAYEMLFLENIGAATGDPWLDVLARDETFTGFGVQTAAGLGVRLAPAVGLFAEAGYHWGSPSQGYVIDGIPVDLQVNMDGPFLRGGLRFGL